MKAGRRVGGRRGLAGPGRGDHPDCEVLVYDPDEKKSGDLPVHVLPDCVADHRI